MEGGAEAPAKAPIENGAVTMTQQSAKPAADSLSAFSGDSDNEKEKVASTPAVTASAQKPAQPSSTQPTAAVKTEPKKDNDSSDI